ncbi:hypothetical protein ACB092_03G190900, partial [Castanea dentata]
SKLPDEILVSILSLLTLKEMQRTTILAKRWRYLWTRFSLRKKVKKLSLDFMMNGVASAYTLTSQIFHSHSLDSLTDLSLTSVEVTGEVLEYVLSNCPFIEILHVENSKSLVKLKTSSPLPKLKHLELNCCSLKQ